jgi:two-component system sensor histidine kinase YesM
VKLRGRTLRFKLLFYFFTLILIPIGTLGIIGNVVFSGTIEGETNRHTSQMIDQVKQNVDFYIRDMERTSMIISEDPNVLSFLSMDKHTDEDRRRSVETEVRRLLSSFTKAHPEIAGILLVNEADWDISNEMFRVSRDPLTLDPWYGQAMESPDRIQLIGKPMGRNITSHFQFSADDVLSVVKAIKHPDSEHFQGVILIDLKLATIEKVIQGVQPGKSGFIYITDSEGEIIYAPDTPIAYRVNARWFDLETSNSFVRTIHGSDYRIIFTVSELTKWKMIGVFSLNETLLEVTRVRNITLAVGTVTLILAVTAALLFTNSIVHPMAQLRRLMRKAVDGVLKVYLENVSRDEIGQLGRSFNKMISEIRNLINQVVIEQKSKREAELKVLQAQINPHFLYNTLDTIHWMAKDRKADDIVKLVVALTNLFRISLSKGREIVKFAEELEHIRSYLIIQKARYEDKLSFSIIAEPELNRYSVVKLILQPLVENAIYHGIKAKRGEGMISITASKTEDDLRIRVEDNGGGIKEERLREIRDILMERIPLNELQEGKSDDSSDGKSGYGLFNVNERLRLRFGSEYGIRIESVWGTGTVVEIVHPLIDV